MSSPFNEEKYKALLEGLEISEVMLSEINSSLFRIEAEYYQAKYIQLEAKLKGFHTLGEFAEKIDCGPFGSNLLDTEYQESGILVVRPFNLRDYSVESDNLVYISNDIIKKNNLKIYTKGTLLFSRVGDIKFGVLNYEKATISPNIIAVHFQDSKISKYFAVYFSTRYGFLQIQRQLKIAAQPTISTEIIENLKVPFDPNLMCVVNELFDKSTSKLAESKSLYSEAENILLSELDLKDWQSNNNPINIKQLKESFLASGRLDAEYYQQKYDEIESIIKKFNYNTLDNLCILVNHGMQPPYIENGEMRVFSQKWIKDKEIDYSFIEDINEPRTSMEFANSNPDYICRRNDIVHYSVGANIGYCHTYLSDVPMMPGSFITLIRANEDKINPIYLGVVLNSIIGRIQSEKRKSGTAQPYVYPKDIKEFLIPILPKPIQETISAKIQESFALKKESKRLLDKAKTLVEREIEKGGE